EGDWEQGPIPQATSPTQTSTVLSGPRTLLVFTSQQVWCCDNSGLADALGYPSGNVYAIGPDGKTRPFLFKPFDLWPAEAALNRSLDLLAIAMYPRNSNSPTVVVADTAGTLMARFPGKSRFRWSSDGSRLALIGDNLIVWDRHKGIVAKIPV